MTASPAAAEVLERELRRLEPIAEAVAHRYRVPGHDRDDLRQLARIGLWQAISSFDGSSPLEAFARMVAERRVIDALAAARSQRRGCGEPEISWQTAIDQEGGELGDLIADPVPLAERIEAREELRTVLETLPALSPAERSAVALLAAGESYARASATGSKRAENAVDRARRKLRRATGARGSV